MGRVGLPETKERPVEEDTLEIYGGSCQEESTIWKAEAKLCQWCGRVHLMNSYFCSEECKDNFAACEVNFDVCEWTDHYVVNK